MKNQVRKILKSSILRNKNLKNFVFELEISSRKPTFLNKNSMVVNKNILKHSKLFSNDINSHLALKEPLIVNSFETDLLLIDYVKKKNFFFLIYCNNFIFINKFYFESFIFGEKNFIKIFQTKAIYSYIISFKVSQQFSN